MTQFMIHTKREWMPEISKWRITLADGSPLGLRLQKNTLWPDYPKEVENEDDAMFYQKEWSRWINDQNKGLKNYNSKRG